MSKHTASEIIARFMAVLARMLPAHESLSDYACFKDAVEFLKYPENRDADRATATEIRLQQRVQDLEAALETEQRKRQTLHVQLSNNSPRKAWGDLVALSNVLRDTGYYPGARSPAERIRNFTDTMRGRKLTPGAYGEPLTWI